MIKTIIIPVRGTHCRSCEILIENNVKAVKGVKNVKANYRSGKVEVEMEQKSEETIKEIHEAVVNAGYAIGEKDKLPWISRNPLDYKHLGIAIVIIFVLYLIGKTTGIFSLDIANGENTSLWIVPVVGLVAGLSTCMALVGGLVLGIASRHADLHPEASAMQKFRPHIYFNMGRIAGYIFFGGLIGLLGSVLQFSNGVLGILTVAVGIVMFFLGFKLIEIFPALKDRTLTLPKSVSKLFGLHKETREYSHRNAALAGALTFFLPCGFTQAMQLLAVSTGSFAQGALIMGLFALGTAPGLLSLGGLTSLVKGKAARIFFMMAGIAVIIFGWINVTNGTRLFTGGGDVSNGNEGGVVIEDGVQVVRMTQKANGYEPNVFSIKKGVKVRWIINSVSSYSCAAYISMPKMGINKPLTLGENIIEFTPTENGTLPFTCSMGMYSGKFIVGEQAGKSVLPPQEDIDQTAREAAVDSKAQVIRAVYTLQRDIVPNTFEVKKGVPVKFEIDVKENGLGCMSTVMIPGLYNKAQYLKAGQKMVLSFTPTAAGNYEITCAMGVPRGLIKVIN